MTDTWVVYREVPGPLNPTTGQYEDATETVYIGPGKLQTFEAYEQSGEAVAHTFTTMRLHLHLPVNEASAEVTVDDFAVCTASPSDAANVGAKVRIAGTHRKSMQTARRFPVAEVVS